MDDAGGRQSTACGHDSGETLRSTEGESLRAKLSGKRTETVFLSFRETENF